MLEYYKSHGLYPNLPVLIDHRSSCAQPHWIEELSSGDCVVTYVTSMSSTDSHRCLLDWKSGSRPTPPNTHLVASIYNLAKTRRNGPRDHSPPGSFDSHRWCITRPHADSLDVLKYSRHYLLVSDHYNSPRGFSRVNERAGKTVRKATSTDAGSHGDATNEMKISRVTLVNLSSKKSVNLNHCLIKTYVLPWINVAHVRLEPYSNSTKSPTVPAFSSATLSSEGLLSVMHWKEKDVDTQR
ncbi:hypothetical protein EDB87DRAFT_1732538 [Lactarius vividus]|nr:hypothetical protein EDB87DRAFT_1732538 [Lactarius vividus]